MCVRYFQVDSQYRYLAIRGQPCRRTHVRETIGLEERDFYHNGFLRFHGPQLFCDVSPCP